ncbi:type II secretory pathway predicted ATPase ExeA [Streptomyces sp. TE3672]
MDHAESLRKCLADTVDMAAIAVVTADEPGAASASATAALAELARTEPASNGARLDIVHVRPEIGTRTALTNALYAALHPTTRPGTRPRPRSLTDTNKDIEGQLHRRAPVVLAVHDAHLLHTQAFQDVEGLWKYLRPPGRPAIVLLGGTRLTTLMRRPALDGLNSLVYTRHQTDEQAQQGQ